MTQDEIDQKSRENKNEYYGLIDEWKPLEEYIINVERKKSAKAKKQIQETNQINKQLQQQQMNKSNDLKEKNGTAENSSKLKSKAAETKKSSFKTVSASNSADSVRSLGKTGKKNSNKNLSNKTSFFAFNFLKKQSNKMNLVRQNSVNGSLPPQPPSKPGEKQDFIRKDSSISNDVFMDDHTQAQTNTSNSNNSSTFSLISKFTNPRGIFAKLMQRSYLLEEGKNDPDNSAAISAKVEDILAESVAELSEEEAREIARKIVDQVLVTAREKLSCSLNRENSTEITPTLINAEKSHHILSTESCATISELNINNTYNTQSNQNVESSLKSDTSLYMDTKNYFSTSVSIENSECCSFQDIENSDTDLHDIKSVSSVHEDLTKSQSTQSLKLKEQFGQEFIETFALNMHRIDKDVTRCDRNYWYFMSSENLQKLKNIMYT
jgi:hypothetical protein